MLRLAAGIVALYVTAFESIPSSDHNPGVTYYYD
jgi:hypothetical protein